MVRREARKRGVFGNVIESTFILFNLFMAFAMFKACSVVGDVAAPHSSNAAVAGAAIGSAMAGGVLIFVWAAGTIVPGALTAFTRGPVVITEETAST